MKQSKINILFIIDYFHRTGGTERHLAYLVTQLPQDAFECSVVIFDLGENPLIDDMRRAGVSVTHVPVGRIYTPNAYWRVLELARIIRRNKVDIVQTYHQTSDTYAAVVARLAGVKHIVSSKRDTAEFKKPRDFFLNRRLRFLFERVIVVSDAVARSVVAKEGIEDSRIVRIYNGVDLRRFVVPKREDAMRERITLGLGENDFVVGMVAVFRQEKNHDVLFEGAAQALESIPSLCVLAVGGGYLLDQFRERCARDYPRLKVIFSGDISDVRRYLKVMDVGCLIPGKNEGFSNAVLEKMAMGLPLVVTDVGGNAEAVLDGQNGIVIPPNDPRSFCEALVALHADYDKRVEMGKRSRQLVEERFSLAGMCAAHAALYRSLLARTT